MAVMLLKPKDSFFAAPFSFFAAPFKDNEADFKYNKELSTLLVTAAIIVPIGSILIDCIEESGSGICNKLTRNYMYIKLPKAVHVFLLIFV